MNKIDITLGTKTKTVILYHANFKSLQNNISIYFPEIKENYKIYTYNPTFKRDMEIDQFNFFDFIKNIRNNNKLKILEIPNKNQLSKSAVTSLQQVEGDKDKMPLFDELKLRGKDKINTFLQQSNKINTTDNELKVKYEKMENEYNQLKEKYLIIDNEKKELNEQLIKKNEEKKELIQKLMEFTEKEELKKKSQLENKNQLIRKNNGNEEIIQNIENENNDLKEKLQNIENENNNLKEKLQNIENENNNLKEKLLNTGNENQDLNENIENENKDLKEKLQKTEYENNTLKIKLENIENKNKELNEKLKNNENDNQNDDIIENKIKTIEEEKNLEINELKKQIEKLNQIINTMNENNNNKMKNLEFEKKNLENNINKEFEKGIETITNKLKFNIQTEISKFQNDLFLKTKDLNSKFFEEQKQNLFKKIEESHNRITEEQEENDQIKNKNLQSIKQNQQPKLIHEGYKCNLCNKTPIIGLRYKCTFCYDFNLCENCYNDVLKNKKSHYNNNHKFIKIDKIIEKSNNSKQRVSSVPKSVSNKTETFKVNYANINEYPKDDYSLFNNLSNNNSPQNSLFIDDESSKSYFIELSKPFQKNEPTPRLNYNINSNMENENEIDDGLSYSYKTQDNKYLIEKNIKPGTQKTSIVFTIINDGENKYKKDITKFICNSKSNLNCKPFTVPPLNINQSVYCMFAFEGLNELNPGEYLIYLDFMVGKKKFGKEITIKLIIEPDKKYEKLREFRKKYDLSEKDFTDKQLLKQLEKYNFDYESTFDSLFN